MRRLQRPLDPNAVKAANAALSAETGGRQLTMEPVDAELRKKWVDAYLKAGGKEATGFNPKQVRKPVQECPNKNWVEVEYLYADDRRLNDKQTGVEGATAIIKHNGSEIARAKLDSCGFAHIDGIPVDITEITYCFDDDPPQYEIFPEFKPHLQTFPPEPDYIDKAKAKLGAISGWTWGNVKDGAEWVGGALAGDFNENPSMGQIVVGTVITLIPIVDQAGDVRDIAAALKKLIWEKRYDETGVWVDLVITIIGCIPELGTVIKGIAKAIKKGAKGLEIADLFRKLNWVGKGNAFEFLKKMSDEFPKYGKFAKDNIDKILKDLHSKLDKVKKYASASISSKIDDILESIREVQKRVSNKVDGVIDDLKKRLDDILSDAEKTEKKGSTQKKNTSKQEKEPFEKISGKGFKLDPKKFEYFFGKVPAPDEALKKTDPKKYEKLKHNYDRSQQLKKVFADMGIVDDDAGRKKLLEIFEEGAKNPEAAKHVGEFGTTITRIVEKDGVKLEIKYFYPKGDMSAVPEVVTVIPKVLKK